MADTKIIDLGALTTPASGDFLRQQRDAPEGEWKLEDPNVGFVRKEAVSSDTIAEK